MGLFSCDHAKLNNLLALIEYTVALPTAHCHQLKACCFNALIGWPH